MTQTELTQGELAFAIAIAFAESTHTPLVLVPYLVLPWIVGFVVGYLVLTGFQEKFLFKFWEGVFAMASLSSLGYLTGLVWTTLKRRALLNDLYLDALTLAGNPRAAESYLIRARTGQLAERRKSLSARDRRRLSDQLSSLDFACRTLGLDYRQIGQSRS